jgi:hypothetical protein
MRLQEATPLRCCLFARFADGIIASLDFRRYRGQCRYGGRQDRLGNVDMHIHDAELLAVFQWSDFVILRDKDDPRAAVTAAG